MILKHLYSKEKEKIIDLLEKKQMNKEFYGKFLIRNSLSENFNLYVLDNNTSFFHISVAKISKFTPAPQDNLLGRSLIGGEFEYKNKLNRNLTLKSFLINSKSPKKLPVLNSLFNLLKITKKNYRGSLILLSPRKGGFNCYSEGVLGFMPRSHATFLFSKTLNLFEKAQEGDKKLSNLSFLLRKNTFIRSNLLIRLSTWWGKITLFPRTSRDKFSINSRKRRKRFFSNKINFVFLTKKNKYSKQKINENKKIKKRN
jgi:hypothetical protein